MSESGSQKFGKYILLDRISTGGMAEIYRAKFVAAAGVTKQVVIKKILPHFADNPHFLSMFVNEARIAVSLSHGNIAQVFDFGEIDGEYFLAMEFVDGPTLSDVIRRASESGVYLPPAHVVYVGIELCRGLAYAHSHTDENGRPLGIVHRDVSPQNVMLTYGGEVKIVDFGIAKARSAGKNDTEHGAIKGKYVYFSPEQARGKTIDHRSDLFSVGILLYESLTGIRPFQGRMIEVLGKIVNGEFAKPRAVNPEIPQAIEAVVIKALAREPLDRYQSAAALQEALASWLARAAPRTNQQSLASLTQYLFAKDLEAQGRAPQLPPPFVDEVSDWSRVRQRPTSARPDSNGVVRHAPSRSTAENRTEPDRPPKSPAEEQSVTAPARFSAGISARTVLYVLLPLLGGSAALGTVLLLGRAGRGVVRVVGPPAHATISVDGKTVATSLPAALEVRAHREHRVHVALEGGPPFETRVTVPRGSVVEVTVPTDSPQQRPLLDDAPAPPPPRPGPVVAWPASKVVLDVKHNVFSVPASRAARLRLDPVRTYLLTAEGQATLGGAREPLRRVLYYAEPARGRMLGDARLGSLGPGESASVSGARAIYGFLFGETPAADAGSVRIKVFDVAAKSAETLSVDAALNAVFLAGMPVARITGLDPSLRYRVSVDGAAPLPGGDKARATLFHTDAVNRRETSPTAAPPVRGLADTSQGAAAARKPVFFAGASKVEFVLPDEGAEDGAGEISVSLTAAGRLGAGPARGARSR